jgi:hypothetical protein
MTPRKSKSLYPVLTGNQHMPDIPGKKRSGGFSFSPLSTTMPEEPEDYQRDGD